jgi:hypothetical protein
MRAGTYVKMICMYMSNENLGQKKIIEKIYIFICNYYITVF